MVRQDNPYPPGSHEHELWAAWHEAYLMQPPCSLLYESESHLRGLVRRFAALTNQLDDRELAAAFRQLILELEAEAGLLEQIADRAYIEIVVHRGR
jgi:hypothetical protein